MPVPNVVTPRVTQAYGRPVPSRLKSVAVRAGTAPTVRWTMVDARGCPVDLTDYQINDPALHYPWRAPGAINDPAPTIVPVTLRVIENTILGFDPDFAGRVVDLAGGVVEVDLDLRQIGGPGIYLAEMAVLADDFATAALANPFNLLVERGLFGGDPTGLPTLAEIRLRLRDDPQTNELLGDFAWDNAEIIQALQEPIDYWNAELPDVGVYYTSQTFPAQYRHWWIRGTIAALYRIAAEAQRRNQLDYQAGGISVQDSNKAPLYDQAAEAAWAAFTAWVRSRKITLNVEGGWGIAGGGGDRPWSTWW